MLYNQIQEALQFIKTRITFTPDIGIILGTGLSTLSEDIEVHCEIPYKDIPYFPESTVQSHQSKLVFGTLSGQKVVAMAGRFHYYEGYTMKQVTFPVRVMKFLGIETIIISNASGSTNASIEAGDIVFVKDHINLQPENPLRGVNDERLGPRFPDMLHTYDKSLIAKGIQVAEEQKIKVHQCVYIGLQGPNLETPAEYNYLHTIGGDLVGMSTVPEVIVARHMDLAVMVISVVSNKCYPIEEITETTVEEVIKVVENSGANMRILVKNLLKKI